MSTRHMGGVYEILNYLTGDNLFTHQLPRAGREEEPWLRTLFPRLMADSPGMSERIKLLEESCAAADGDKEKLSIICDKWWQEIQCAFRLPEMLAVYEMGEDMHTRIDPVEELGAMIGDHKVIKVQL